METLEEARTAGWRILVGELPKGFFVEVYKYGIGRYMLILFYKGRGYKKIVQPGGQRPKAKGAHICSFSVTRCSYEEEQRIIKGIKEEVERVLLQIKK